MSETECFGIVIENDGAAAMGPEVMRSTGAFGPNPLMPSWMIVPGPMAYNAVPPGAE